MKYFLCKYFPTFLMNHLSANIAQMNGFDDVMTQVFYSHGNSFSFRVSAQVEQPSSLLQKGGRGWSFFNSLQKRGVKLFPQWLYVRVYMCGYVFVFAFCVYVFGRYVTSVIEQFLKNVNMLCQVNFDTSECFYSNLSCSEDITSCKNVFAKKSMSKRKIMSFLFVSIP